MSDIHLNIEVVIQSYKESTNTQLREKIGIQLYYLLAKLDSNISNQVREIKNIAHLNALKRSVETYKNVVMSYGIKTIYSGYYKDRIPIIIQLVNAAEQRLRKNGNAGNQGGRGNTASWIQSTDGIFVVNLVKTIIKYVDYGKTQPEIPVPTDIPEFMRLVNVHSFLKAYEDAMKVDEKKKRITTVKNVVFDAAFRYYDTLKKPISAYNRYRNYYNYFSTLQLTAESFNNNSFNSFKNKIYKLYFKNGELRTHTDNFRKHKLNKLKAAENARDPISIKGVRLVPHARKRFKELTQKSSKDNEGGTSGTTSKQETPPTSKDTPTRNLNQNRHATSEVQKYGHVESRVYQGLGFRVPPQQFQKKQKPLKRYPGV